MGRPLPHLQRWPDRAGPHLLRADPTDGRPVTESVRKRRALPWLVGVVAVAGTAAVISNVRGLGELLGQTDWTRVVPALLLTGLSYACISAGLVSLGRAVGVSAPRWPMMRIAFISVAVNQLISFGGVAGYSLRAVLSKRYGVTTGDALAMSLVHSYLNNLAMFFLLGLGLLQLVRDPATDEAWRRTLEAGGMLVVAFLVVSTVAMFSGRLRGALVHGSARLAARLFPTRWSDPIEFSLRDLDIALGRTATALRHDPAAAWWPCVFLLLDWLAAFAVLWLCLDAVGEPVAIGVLLGGFSIGVVAGFASLVPGGLGVQDGSLAAVLALQGIPVDRAVLGTLLFRLVYYVVPFLTTLPVYASFLRQQEVEAGLKG
ncbi:MAG: flippase-like domain-containing protein [Dehalococcoidia bacterium]|nr:MAG: flippase-like domain-containing protein [Dehalococcoidia bacterium]